MQLNELVAVQHQFDQEHGWAADDADLAAVLKMLTEDVVGMVGEVGEFANHLKKLNLRITRDRAAAETEMVLLRPAMAEELVDTFVYLMRLATHLKVDLESQYLAKLAINRERYLDYERGE